MSSHSVETLRFLTPELARAVAQKVGTPAYVYSEEVLESYARKALAFPNAYGLRVRFAMKACPNRNVLAIFSKLGIHIDASSGFEVERALHCGIPASHILLTCQELPKNFHALISKKILFNACSLRQLETFGKLFPGKEVGVRINPGLGSGGNNRTNVGGPASSFGIWKDQIDEVKKILGQYHLKVTRLHTHIGSGSDPEVWQKVSAMSIAFAEMFPEATTFDLGGGFKIGRMSHEKTTDLEEVGAPVKKAFVHFYEKTGRKIHLEIEPGTYLVAMAGALVTTIQDMTDTGNEGYRFLKIDGGMTEVLRPSLYGAQHPLVVIPANESPQTEHYLVTGHCCESGDILTPAPGDPEALAPRLMKKASVGDLLVVEGAGAYCAGMSAKHYNSFPEAPEVLVRKDGSFVVIRERENPKDIYQNEKRVVR